MSDHIYFKWGKSEWHERNEWLYLSIKACLPQVILMILQIFMETRESFFFPLHSLNLSRDVSESILRNTGAIWKSYILCKNPKHIQTFDEVQNKMCETVQEHTKMKCSIGFLREKKTSYVCHYSHSLYYSHPASGCYCEKHGT